MVVSLDDMRTAEGVNAVCNQVFERIGVPPHPVQDTRCARAHASGRWRRCSRSRAAPRTRAATMPSPPTWQSGCGGITRRTTSGCTSCWAETLGGGDCHRSRQHAPRSSCTMHSCREQARLALDTSGCRRAEMRCQCAAAGQPRHEASRSLYTIPGGSSVGGNAAAQPTAHASTSTLRHTDADRHTVTPDRSLVL